MARMGPHDYLGDDPLPNDIFRGIEEVVHALGEASARVTESQIAFRRRRLFAAVWIPARYVHGRTAPLVLTIFLPYRDRSERWKEVVEPAPGRFTHHLELAAVEDVDADVEAWVRRAWEAAA